MAQAAPMRSCLFEKFMDRCDVWAYEGERLMVWFKQPHWPLRGVFYKYTYEMAIQHEMARKFRFSIAMERVQ